MNDDTPQWQWRWTHWAALGIGAMLWMAACWLGSMIYLAWRSYGH